MTSETPSGDQDNDKTSISMIDAAKSNNPRGWKRLTDQFGGLVYKWCRNAGLNQDDAFDVSQEVFVAVARNLHRFKFLPIDGSFRRWLRTIVKNKLADYWRDPERRVRAHGGSSWGNVLAGLSAPSASSMSLTPEPNHHAELIRRIQGEFSSRDWGIFQRLVVDGKSPAEIATEFAVSENVVYLVKSRIIKRFRTEFRTVFPEI